MTAGTVLRERDHAPVIDLVEWKFDRGFNDPIIPLPGGDPSFVLEDFVRKNGIREEDVPYLRHDPVFLNDLDEVLGDYSLDDFYQYIRQDPGLTEKYDALMTEVVINRLAQLAPPR